MHIISKLFGLFLGNGTDQSAGEPPKGEVATIGTRRRRRPPSAAVGDPAACSQAKPTSMPQPSPTEVKYTRRRRTTSAAGSQTKPVSMPQPNPTEGKYTRRRRTTSAASPQTKPVSMQSPSPTGVKRTRGRHTAASQSGPVYSSTHWEPMFPEFQVPVPPEQQEINRRWAEREAAARPSHERIAREEREMQDLIDQLVQLGYELEDCLTSEAQRRFLSEASWVMRSSSSTVQDYERVIRDWSCYVYSPMLGSRRNP